MKSAFKFAAVHEEPCPLPHSLALRQDGTDKSVFSVTVFNLLKPTGHVMHQQFNIQELYSLPPLYLCFCIYLRTNSDLCHLQYKLIGFYNRDEKCLQRGTD